MCGPSISKELDHFLAEGEESGASRVLGLGLEKECGAAIEGLGTQNDLAPGA